MIQRGTLLTVEAARRDPRYRDIIDNRRTVLAEPPTHINFTHDRSCNLFCPSCRTKKINNSAGLEFLARKRLHDRLVDDFFGAPTDRAFTLNITGSGDPIASRLFREFLFDLDGADFPNLRIVLQTNGVLLTPKILAKLDRLKSNIHIIIVSFDAATKETHGLTRRGGDWDLLLQNVAHLAERRRAGEIAPLRFDYVVQAANYMEMPAMVTLGRRFAADCVAFSRAHNWGTWSAGEFDRVAVWRPAHPRHEDFMKVMADPALGDPIVDLSNLASYRGAA